MTEPTTTSHAETDECLRRAESHFNAGRQLYFEGDLAVRAASLIAAVDALLDAPDSIARPSAALSAGWTRSVTHLPFRCRKTGRRADPGEQAESSIRRRSTKSAI